MQVIRVQYNTIQYKTIHHLIFYSQQPNFFIFTDEYKGHFDALKRFKTQWLLYVLQFLTQQNYTFYPLIAFVCFVWIPEKAVSISVHSVNRRNVFTVRYELNLEIQFRLNFIFVGQFFSKWNSYYSSKTSLLSHKKSYSKHIHKSLWV